MRRTLFLPIVFVLGAVALFVTLMMTRPSPGSANQEADARQVPTQQAKQTGSCPSVSHMRPGFTWPCSMPECAPLCNGSSVSYDGPMLKKEEATPEPPAAPYYDRSARDGAATLYDLSQKNARMAVYKLGLRGPACTATRDSILGH